MAHTSTPNQSLADGGSITASELILRPGFRNLPNLTIGVFLSITPSFVLQHLTLEVSPLRHILSVMMHEGGAVDGYNAASESMKRGLIPLPPLSSTFTTLPLFEPQLFIGGWVNSKDAFLSVYPVTFELNRSAKFKKFTPQVVLSHDEFVRINTYRNQLPADMLLDQGGGEEQNRTANEAQDGNATDILPEDEPEDDGTDEDCMATMKDDLILLAHSHPSWIPVLEKYLEAERAEIQAERTSMVESWLQSVIEE